MPTNFPLKNSALLIVDDQKSNLKLLYDILQRQGFQVFAAKGGQYALEIGRQTQPDLCLLDINMPDMNGYEVCRHFKKHPATANIPIIFLTALGETEDKLKGFLAGGVDYITKPFQPQEVIARVHTHLSLSYTRRALAQNEARLQKAHDELEYKVAERTLELQQANLQLRQLSRMKDEFLANVSHELRTPLNGILGNAEILLEGVYGAINAKQQQAAQHIQDGGQDLLTLINRMLDLANSNKGGLELHVQAVSAQRLCEESVQQIQETAQRKRLSISLALDPQVGKIQVDPQRFKQILLDLLSNAVKFTAEGGQIGLESRADSAKQRVCFAVWDNGIGIDPKRVDQLFQPFVQLDSRLAREYEGSGLGLSLVKRLVDLHGGSLSVESQPGQGSRFEACFPLRIQQMFRY